MESLTGIFVSVVAGLLTGTFMWPMKIIKKLQFEHYWFLGMFFGLLVLPWLIVLIAVPSAFSAFSSVKESLLIANLLSVGWGIANVLYGICIIRIGAAIAGAVLTSFGIVVGVAMPLIFKGSGLFSGAPELFSPAGMVILMGVIIILTGVYFIARAGILREAFLNKQSNVPDSGKKFITGLVLSIIAGILSSCISLTFVYSQGPVVAAFKAQGAGDLVANIAVWAGGLLGGVFVNLAYPLVLMVKNKNMNVLLRPNMEFLLAIIIGVQLITGAVMLGRGMILLGVLGASVGFGIQQSVQIVGNQIVGFGFGEWRNVLGQPRRLMYLGIFVVLVAIVILAYSNIV